MNRKELIPVVFEPGNRIVQASQGNTILEAALAAKINISHSCGGSGTCGTCRVKVLKGLENFEERNEIESEMAIERGLELNERLSCQNEVTAGLVLEIPEE